MRSRNTHREAGVSVPDGEPDFPMVDSCAATRVSGKQRRLRRLIDADGRTLLVAVDHSLTNGPSDGLSDMRCVLRSIVRGGADAVIAHRGAATHAMPLQRQTGLVVHLSGNSSLSNDADLKTLVCDPETAEAIGADAVSIHLTLGAGHREDRESLSDLGRTAKACDRLGLPLLVMIYPRTAAETRARAILHAARLASELGADIVKVAHPGENDLAELAAASLVPIVIAGGEKSGPWNEFLAQVKIVLAAGIAGLCVGRRIFTHPDPACATSTLRGLVHGDDILRSTVYSADPFRHVGNRQ